MLKIKLLNEKAIISYIELEYYCISRLLRYQIYIYILSLLLKYFIYHLMLYT